MERGGSFESSAESAAVQTATGGGQSSVQRQSRHEQRGNVTMSERSQIESEAAHEAGVQSAASRSVQQFDRHEKGARRLDGGGVEHSEDTYNKVNERSEAQSRRQLADGEQTSQSSSVSKSESRQTTSVADLGGGATQRQSVTKRSQVSEVSEVSQTSSSSRAEPRRLGTGGRSASLQTDHLDTFSTAGSRAAASPRAGGGGGILRELERLLADEDRYEQARRAVRRDDSSSLNARSEQIRREVDNLVATFFDRKRDRSGRSDFFDSASRRAEQLARDFARDDDDPWREEEARWRRQRELRRTGSDDFFEDAVRRAETLVREMRDRKERRRRDEEDIFSRYGAEIDQFFGRRQDSGFGSRRGGSDSFRSASAFADDLVRDFLQDTGGRGAEDSWANRHRERTDSHSTNVDIDEVLSQASTIGRERATRPARPNTSEVDIEELSASSRRSRTAGADRLVDDIVRQFAADDFDDEDTLRGQARGMNRQTSNTSTLDEAASLRPDSRLSEPVSLRPDSRLSDVEEELRQAEQRRQTELAEEQAQQQRREAEAEREERERRRQERQQSADAEKRRQLEELELVEQQAERFRQEREQRRQERAAQELQADQEMARAQEQAERRRRALDKALAEQNAASSTQQEQVTESCSRQESATTERSSVAEERSSQREEQSSSRHEERSSSRHEEQSSRQEFATADEKGQRQTGRQSHESTSESAERVSESAAGTQQGEQRSSPSEPTAEREETGEGAAEARSEASAAALRRAEELLFGFVPDWEREEQRWSKVRTERIAEASGDKKVRDLMADYRPMRHTRDDDLRAQRLHERKTEEYEHLMSGDVWRGLKDESRGGRARPGAGGGADSVLSELRSARQSTASSAQTARSQFSQRKAESMRETGGDRSAGRGSKLDEFRSFKSELWQDK
ncbi:trichohyalin-like [Amphibalanus amphitrite]|uniref:trichohyalin-like n=1 Tax=Amphibalanus amphitrite TaxID=1232801 RepID=UPI001C92A9CB|nr:trichohyalin-like [Amphibalanus amphitrite]